MGKRKRTGGKGKKKTHKKPSASDEKKVDKSFVMKRGNIGKMLQALLGDTRRVMLPHTALHLRERKSNTLKDFLHVAGPLGVTHFLIFSATDFGSYLRVARVPHGPTLTFRISSYTLVRDIVSLQQNPHSPASEFKHPPLVVLNNFKGPDEQVKLMSVIFQKMFPPINIKTMRVENCKRVVLFDYDAESQKVQLRHYLITSHPIGVSKSVKRILQKKLPNLSELRDISQYVLGNAKASESDMEDGDDTHVEVERQIKKKKRVRKRQYVTEKKTKTQQSAVRLHELGPRLTLSLIKIQEGFCDGQVLYHQYVTKTAEEEAQLEAKKEHERELKEERRKKQIINLAKKGKLPPGMEVPDTKTEEEEAGDDEDGEAEEEAEEGFENEEKDEDEQRGQDGDDEDRDYGSEGEEDAEIETLTKRKPTGKKSTKRRKVEPKESVADGSEDTAPTHASNERQPKGEKKLNEGTKRQTPKLSLKMPVSKNLQRDLSKKRSQRAGTKKG